PSQPADERAQQSPVSRLLEANRRRRGRSAEARQGPSRDRSPRERIGSYAQRRLRRVTLPEGVGEPAPLVPQIRAARDLLELPVRADERAELRRMTFVPALLEHADVPAARINPELACEGERAVAKRIRLCLDAGH